MRLKVLLLLTYFLLILLFVCLLNFNCIFDVVLSEVVWLELENEVKVETFVIVIFDFFVFCLLNFNSLHL